MIWFDKNLSNLRIEHYISVTIILLKSARKITASGVHKNATAHRATSYISMFWHKILSQTKR